jgi:hypothetical protein
MFLCGVGRGSDCGCSARDDNIYFFGEVVDANYDAGRLPVVNRVNDGKDHADHHHTL